MTLTKLMRFDQTRDLAYPEALSCPGPLNLTDLTHIDISNHVCDPAEGLCHVARDGVPFLFDSGHLTGTVSRSPDDFPDHVSPWVRGRGGGSIWPP